MNASLMSGAILIGMAATAAAQQNVPTLADAVSWTHLDPSLQDWNRHSGSGWVGHSQLFLGVKKMDAAQWDPLENQLEISWLNDFKGAKWPVSFAADLRFSTDGDSQGGLDITVTTWELNFGARMVLGKTKVQPYFGAGLSTIIATVSASGGGLSGYDDDIAFGFWADFGINFEVSKGMVIGFEVAYSTAENTDDLEFGGTHVGFTIGGTF